ncbi:MAG: rRNA maturation RNase YbeY [Candidatus Eiseniibacteriota bacterium]|nr:MAG: rRNA maturation RNase YbeY [Candidatus Eisenbacteria bacterium]
MEISVANRQRRIGISSKNARLIASSVLRGESACFDEISIAFLGDRAMRRLNSTFAGRDESTDTLAFELTPGLPPKRAGSEVPAGRSVGEVVVCTDRALQQSKRYRVGLEKELARLLIHGLLHLCGFSDSTKSERARMHRREDHYLASLREPVAGLVPRRRRGSVSSGSGR